VVQFFIDNFPLLRDAFLKTLSLSVLAGLLALVLGTLLAAFRVSPITPLRGLATFYVETFRNTPLTVVFFFIIFGLPQIDFAVGFFTGSVLAVGLYTAAFVCEAVRSGINAVSPGQAEAARAIGLGFGASLREVILPQAFRGAIAPLGNTLIALTKNTTVVATIGVAELSYVMRGMIEFNPSLLYAIFLLVAACFVLLTLPMGLLFTSLSRRLVVQR
jgi:glutamate transport system permease protein